MQHDQGRRPRLVQQAAEEQLKGAARRAAIPRAGGLVVGEFKHLQPVGAYEQLRRAEGGAPGASL